MLAMQYSIELPYGYEPERIRERVQARSKLFQGLPGLIHKSYLFSAADHLYAPFYIWADVTQARQFLFDDLFRGVIESFSRPRVRQWMVLHHIPGNTSKEPSFALSESDRIAPEDDLQRLYVQEVTRMNEVQANPNLYFQAVLLDSERWEMVRYSLWHDEASAIHSHADCVQTYSVLSFV